MEPLTAASPLPPLRGDLDIAPFEHEGRSLFLVRDAEAQGDEALGLSPGGLAVAALFDGRRAAAEVAAELSKQSGADIPAEDVLRVAEQLRAAGLLDTEDARARRRARLEAFLRAPTRPAVFQGRGGYPEKPRELTAFLDRFFADPKGPGRPLPARPTRAGAWGLVAPHIDFHRGGPAYAWSYAALADSPPPDVVVALGVAHMSPDSPWVMTRKPYETPFGPAAVDEGLYDEIAQTLWYDPRADEWVHRREHSLEFQAVWLRRLWGDKTPPWVPILCSTFERFSPDRAPSATPTVEEALRKVGALLAARAKTQRVLILAGIDLAHVGPRFGDDIELTP